jgi:hypothetical protein
MMSAINMRIVAVQAMLDCDHPKTVIVWNFSRGGHRQLRKQCAVCGALVGPVLPASEAPPGTPQANAAAFAEADARWKLKDQLIAEKRSADDAQWWVDYNRYLTTPEWREKRRRVLDRAGGLCEGCGGSKATQVHHTTYAHTGDEFLWELRAVCCECHARVHAEAES